MGASESTGRLNEKETEEERRRRGESGGSSTGAAAIAIATAGAAVAAWGISRMLSDTEEKDEARMITTHDQGANRNRRVDQTQPKYFGSGSVQPGLYAPTPEGINIKSTKKSIWFPPPPNCYKMNTDGGFRPGKEGRPSGYAGILRNHDCECIRVFRGWRTGLTNILEVEIFGILKGLELLVELGLRGAILENDNDEAVFWTKGENKTHYIPKERMSHNCKVMIDKCRTIARANNIDIRNIDRDANECANELVRLAIEERNQTNQYVLQTDLPGTVKTLVDKDKAAYYRN